MKIYASALIIFVGMSTALSASQVPHVEKETTKSAKPKNSYESSNIVNDVLNIAMGSFLFSQGVEALIKAKECYSVKNEYTYGTAAWNMAAFTCVLFGLKYALKGTHLTN